LDLGLFFSARAEDTSTLRAQFLNRWARLALTLTHAPTPPDELEQNLILVLLFGVLSGADRSEVIHALLQRRVRGYVPHEWVDAALPNPASRRAIALVPDSRQEMWANAMARVLSSRTPWMDAIEAWKAVCSGREIPTTNSILREPEGTMMCAIVRREVNKDQILIADGKTSRPCCPRHYMVLPAFQASRLRSQHIASAVNCCNRILLDIAP
jgi:hypothetical protein